MSTLAMHRRGLRLACLVAIIGGMASVHAADLSLESASLSFNPDARRWYVNANVCNDSTAGDSGLVVYELRLTSGDRVWTIGSVRSIKNLRANTCRAETEMAIRVKTDVPPGTYGIQLVIGEHRDGSFVQKDKTTFEQTFIRSGGGE